MDLYAFISDFSCDKQETNWRQTNSLGYQSVRYSFLKQEKKHS